ncbi:MAG: two-component regulator propeller domain-containing protein, partial [Acidobacteriota bacterium]
LTISLLREGLVADGCAVPRVTLPNVQISSLHRDANGNLWIGTIGRGLLSVTLNGGASTAYLAPAVLPDNTVLLLFEDRQHNIWAGAQDGLVRLSRPVVTTLAAAEGLLDDNVSTTYEDREGTLWIVTFTGQMYRLNGETPVRYYLPRAFRDLRVRTVFEDSRGDFWFGTSGAGAVRLSRGKATHYTSKEGLRSNSVREIFEDSRGMVWFATTSGLSRWNGSAFTNYYLEEGLSYPSVRCIGETAEGDILAGTDAGLNRIRDGRVMNDPVFAELRAEKIWSLYVDGGSVWLGTRGGGLVLVRDGKITRFTTRDGLVSNSIYQIVDDRAGRLWLSGPVGVSSVPRGELDAIAGGAARQVHAVAYGSSDGMATSQMYGGLQPAGCRRASGELWFPSVRGAVKLDPAHLPERRSGPVLVESVSAGDTMLAMSGEVVIPPGRGKLQFDFTACDLIAPQQVSFRYKLEGFDDSWSIATHPRAAYYSNLPPGHYRFRVLSEDTGAAGVSSEASLSVYRKPAFHQTLWFYTLLTVLLACGLWAGMWVYARQTRARFALLLNERTRLAREMHDTVIQGCVGVSTLLEAVARFQRTNLAEAAQLLSHARSQIKETLEEARQAVWDLRHSGSQTPIFDLFDLARKLGDEYGVHVETAIEGERIALDPATDRTLLLVGREALRNSVAHGKPARISVRIAFDPASVRMDVRDDGKGFDSARAALDPKDRFGITGMRERIEQLGGTFHLHSRPGEGTVVTVCVPATGADGGEAHRSAQNATMPR